MPLPINYQGKQFHQLTAICFTGKYSKTVGGNKKRIWLFRCDCGNLCEKVIEKVVKGNIKSCGCRKGKYRGLQALQYSVYAEGYKNGDLTFEEVLQLSQEYCYYCGSPVQETGSIRKARGKQDLTWQYHGLDRLDNSQTHTKDNCVPACWGCNELKRGRNFGEFMNKVISIYHNRFSSAVQSADTTQL